MYELDNDHDFYTRNDSGLPVFNGGARIFGISRSELATFFTTDNQPDKITNPMDCVTAVLPCNEFNWLTKKMKQCMVAGY